MSCPSSVEIHTQFECILLIAMGTNMDIHVDMDDGTDYQFISPGIYYIHILHYLLNYKNILNIHSKSNFWLNLLWSFNEILSKYFEILSSPFLFYAFYCITTTYF